VNPSSDEIPRDEPTQACLVDLAAADTTMKKTNTDDNSTAQRDPYERFASAFSISYMSDTKWRKALGAIADAALQLERASWKFIDSEHVYDWGVPRRTDLLPTGLADGRFQPVEYKWIEWIRFPRCWRQMADVGHSVTQDLEGLKRVLAAIGSFHLVEDEQGVTLFGYGR